MDPRRIIFHPKFKPLFQIDRRGGPRYTVLTSGRAGGKSTAVSAATVCDTYLDDNTILYCRQTMSSAEVSVMPEYTDKIKLLGKGAHFATTKDIIINRLSGGHLIFRGIQTSSGNQTAKLKSVPKLRKFFLDEAQELVKTADFDTIDLSIRVKNAPNEVMMALNPTDIHHWIYKRFFKKPGVPFDYNGVVDDVRYIHTCWTDMRAYLSPSFIEQALKCERENPEKYQNIYLGDWSVQRSGLIYPRWEACTLADIPLGLEWWYCNDWGYSGDPDALCRMAFDALTRTLYVVEVMYSTGKLTRDVARAVREDCEAIGMSVDAALVYCDPARPDNIAELRTIYGINAVPGINRDKPGRIGYLQGFRVKYVGRNIGEEAATYSWEPSKEDPEVFTDTPQDGGDHCFVGSTKISTTNGEKRIDELTENDLVLTSEGYRRVFKIFDNGYKEIRKYKIIFRNFAVEIEATPDHRIKTAKGWKQLKELCAADMLFLSRSSMERNLLSIGTVSSDSAHQLVQEPIVAVLESETRVERVYDICVEDMHEYFANGVLVHNCMDAISYGSTHLRRMGIPNDDGERLRG